MSDHIHPMPMAIVADDEDLGRLLLADAAVAAGLTPLVFDNGLEALAAALTNDVSMVLLDVEMPGMNGFEVCQRIRAEKRASLPIVMVTGLDDEAAVTRAFEAGATDFVSKPVNWSLLPHRLAYILRNSEREAKISTLVEAIPDALWVVSAKGELRWSQNDRRTSQEEPSKSSDDTNGLIAAVPSNRLTEVLNVIAATARDGTVRTLELRHDALETGPHSSELRLSRCEGGDVLVVRQDTSERAAAASRIERLAFYDVLTGLPNRQHCIDIAADYLSRAEAAAENVAFLYLDLNSFKRINDTFGHSVGDEVLQKVAATLSRVLDSLSSTKARPFLARLGGDEFVIILRQVDAKEQAIATAKLVRAALEKPISYGTLEFHATPSIGVAVYPEDGNDVGSLLKHSDTAMYQAKAEKSNVVAYTAAMSARLRDTLDLETRLRRALRDDALDVRYQPKVRLADGVVVGAEALIRWSDAELGEISPNRFIPIAEESGLIVDIGAWMVRAVCTQLSKWQLAGFAVPIAVNVSGKELLFADPARIIKVETERAGISPSLIEAEITESVFVTDSLAGRDSVERMRQLGCRIALDDFGTGYSSLSYLTRFPPDRVKIDRSFIQIMDRSDSDAAIVKAIISLARSLKLLVTAEGIERQAQLNWLRANGCDEGQGYLLSRPIAASAMEALLLHPEGTQFVELTTASVA